MPSLRDRLEDLPALIEHLVGRQAQIAGRHIRLDAGAIASLAGNAWRGNIRELANLLERLAILYPGQTIGVAELPERYRGPACALPPPAADLLHADPGALPCDGLDLQGHLSAIEIGLIRQALLKADGTVAVAARLLRLRRTTLVEKLRKYRLSA